MQHIRELMEVSGYNPVSGYSLDMVKIIQEGLGRSEALRRWVALGRTEGSFYRALKTLKDNLVKLAFLEGKGAGLEGRKMEVWEKYKVVNQLLIAGKKTAAVELGIELVSQAQKLGISEVVVGLASMLEGHFGSLEIDNRRYLRYRKIRKDFLKILEDEIEVKGLQTRLVFAIGRGKDLLELQGEIEELAVKRTGSLNFMRYRFSALSVWYEAMDDMAGLMNAFRETADYYEGCETVPPAALTNLYYRLTPALVERRLYADAEAHLSKALRMVRAGSHNWHFPVNFDNRRQNETVGSYSPDSYRPMFVCDISNLLPKTL